MSDIVEQPLVPVEAAQTPPAMPMAQVADELPEISVLACNPEEMKAAQNDLISWAEIRLRIANEEAADLKENLDIATRNKWGTGGLHRAHGRAVKVVSFYEKMLAALQDGYCIVPNFPVDIFAIRTTRKTPEKMTTTSWNETHEQASNAPPIGEGETVSATPEVLRRQLGKIDGKETTEYYAKAFREVDFPFTLAKPQILDATARAMASKIFDEVGALPGKKKKQDPIIVGRIYDPRGGRRNRWRDERKFVTFMIAWFVDTRDLG